jgi:hypothetical protein
MHPDTDSTKSYKWYFTSHYRFYRFDKILQKAFTSHYRFDKVLQKVFYKSLPILPIRQNLTKGFYKSLPIRQKSNKKVFLQVNTDDLLPIRQNLTIFLYIHVTSDDFLFRWYPGFFI